MGEAPGSDGDCTVTLGTLLAAVGDRWDPGDSGRGKSLISISSGSCPATPNILLFFHATTPRMARNAMMPMIPKVIPVVDAVDIAYSPVEWREGILSAIGN